MFTSKTEQPEETDMRNDLKTSDLQPYLEQALKNLRSAAFDPSAKPQIEQLFRNQAPDWARRLNAANDTDCKSSIKRCRTALTEK